MTKTAQTTVTNADLVHAQGGQYLSPHEYLLWVACPEDYDVEEIAAEDIVHDGAITVVAGPYTIEIDGTGCYYPGNPSRAEDGQPEETLTASSLDAAIASVPQGRSALISDDDDELVATVHADGRVEDADGSSL